MAGLTAAELEAVVSVDDTQVDKGLGGMLGKFEGFGGKAGKVLGVAGAAGGALFGLGLASGMAALSLADVRAQIESELGVSATKAEQLGDIAGSLYANAFGGSLEETADAVTTVVSSIRGMRKATDAEVEAMTAKAMTFADVFEIDIARATQVAGQAVTAGLAKNAGQAFDLLTASMQQVPKNVREDVMDAADEYGPFFAQLGIKGEQAFGMLVKGAEKGMYGIDKTGDALKEFTIRATDGSDATQTAFASIGLNGERMATDLLAGGEKGAKAFDKVIGGLNDMKNPLEQSKAALALFGTPLEDLGTKDMPKFLEGLEQGSKGLGDFQGATEKMVEATGSTPSANITAFWRTIKQETVGALGGSIIPMLTKATGWLNDKLGPAFEFAGDIATKVGGWFQTQFVPALQDLVGEVGPLARKYLPELKGAAGDVKPFFTLLGRIITDVLIPGIGKLARVAIPWMVKQLTLVAKILGAVGRAGIWLWNNALQPTFRFMAGALAKALKMWGSMLQIIGKAPGMGWVGDLGDKLVAAANKAHALEQNINKIPTSKKINVTIDYFGETHGMRPGGKGFGPVPMATGGRATGATFALIGEGREPESVLPDSVLRGLLERAHDAGASKADSGRGRGIRDVVFNGRHDASARELIGELTHALRVAEHGGVYA